MRRKVRTLRTPTIRHEPLKSREDYAFFRRTGIFPLDVSKLSRSTMSYTRIHPTSQVNFTVLKGSRNDQIIISVANNAFSAEANSADFTTPAFGTWFALQTDAM